MTTDEGLDNLLTDTAAAIDTALSALGAQAPGDMPDSLPTLDGVQDAVAALQNVRDGLAAHGR